MKVLLRFIIFVSLLSILTACKVESLVTLDGSSALLLCLEPLEDEFQSGTGTAEDPYTICTADQFMLIASDTQYWDKSFSQKADIDLSTALTPFQPVGVYDTLDDAGRQPFTGNYNGNSFKISGLNYEATSTTLAAGLFAHTEGSTLENIVIENGLIKANVRGALVAGYSIDTAFDNIQLSGRVEPTGLSDDGVNLAAFVGRLQIDDTSKAYYIRNSSSSATIHGRDAHATVAGIIFASSDTQVDVTNVSTTGDVTQSLGGNSVGGFIGLIILSGANNVNFTLKNCTRNGNTYLTEGTGGSWSGNFIGQIQASSGTNQTLLLEDISVEGDLHSVANFNVRGSIAGLIGSFTVYGDSSTYTLRRAGVIGDIRILNGGAVNNNNVGGLVGYLNTNNGTGSSVTITQSYYIGDISSDTAVNVDDVGGLIGEIRKGGGTSTVLIDSNYADVTETLTSMSNAYALVGRHFSSPNVTYTDNFFNAPTALTGGIGRGDPSNSANNVELNDTQIFEEASFVGASWNFSTIWSINEGSASPRHR